jgi:hypothetical protein
MRIQFVLLSLFGLIASRGVKADEWELKIRPHATRVVFGDPLYVEATLTNRGKEPALAPAFSLDTANVGFRVRNPETRLEFGAAGGDGAYFNAGAGGPGKHEPGETVKRVWPVFLPNAFWFDHPFWKEGRAGKEVEVDIWAVFGVAPGLVLRSERLSVTILPRPDDEMKAIEFWAKAKGVFDSDTVIWPSDFGINVGVLCKKDTRELANAVKTGTLAELLQRTLLLQEFCDPPEKREARSAELVEWVRKQPDIMRQSLANAVPSIVNDCLSESATIALNRIADDRP